MTTFSQAMEWIFGGDFPNDPLRLHQIAMRGATVYLLGLLVVRVGKSRLISRASALDVILGFMLGSLLSRGITGNASISGTFVASAVLVAMHSLFTAIGFHWHALGSMIKGHVRPVIDDGRPLEANLRRSHISEEDLLGELRLQGVESCAQVERAFKERNGEVSVIKKRGSMRVVDVAVAAGVQTVRVEVD
jgi:uncharacterized membrane protein YcaP (DUF421 family)